MDRLKEKELRAEVRKAEIEQELEKKHDEVVDSIRNAISHLKGYSEMIEAKTGFKPVAVNKCIKELKEMLK